MVKVDRGRDLSNTTDLDCEIRDHAMRPICIVEHILLATVYIAASALGHLVLYILSMANPCTTYQAHSQLLIVNRIDDDSPKHLEEF